MANIKKIKLDNTIYDLHDANAVHSVNGQSPDASGNVSVTAELPEGLVKYNSLSTIETVTPLNADTLETHPASYFATASDVSNLQTEQENINTSLSNLQTEQENINTSLSNKQETITKQSVTFSTDWIGDDSPYSQIVTISGATANSKIDLQPDVAVIQQMIDDGTAALQIVNVDGTLTAYAVGEKPTVTLTVQATVTEVSA